MQDRITNYRNGSVDYTIKSMTNWENQFSIVAKSTNGGKMAG